VETGLSDLAFGADGRRLMTCNKLNRVAVWDPQTGQDPLILPMTDTPLSVAVSPDGQRLACSTDDGAVTIWDPATGQRLLTLQGHMRKAMGIDFSPDGSVLAGGAHDQYVQLWDAATGALHATLKHEAGVYQVAFSPDGQLLATCINPITKEHEFIGKL